MKKKIIVILIIFLFLIITGSILFMNINGNKNQKQRNERYEEIKKDIDNELKRYMYVIAPKCQKNGPSRLITHRELVYNAGMDKEKFLDVDNKSYCKAYVSAECVEDRKWEWKIMISCKDYEDEGYINWEKEFEPKN